MLGRVFLCRIVFATHSVYLKPPCAHARRKAKGRKHEMRLSSCFRLATRHAKMRKCEDERQNHDTLDVACFRVATFRPARRKHDRWKAKRRNMKSFVLSCGQGRHAKTRNIVTFSCFRVATFRPARQRYDKQEAKRRNMKSFVLSCGHAKTRKSDHLAGFRVATFRLFASKTR